ncbi:MAG: hypothetical protein AAGH64_12320, partial [Planctomycetota bacterium]
AELEAELRAESQAFLTGLFSYGTPSGPGRGATRLQILEAAIADLDGPDPLPANEEARRCSDLATSMAGLGEFERALALARRGLNAVDRIDTPGDASSELLAFDLRRTSTNILSDLARYEEALHEQRELISLSGDLYGQSDARTLRALRSFAITQRRTGNAEEAVGLLQEIAVIADTSRDPDNEALAALIRIDLVSALNFLGRGDESFAESSRLLDDAERIDLPVMQEVRMFYVGAQAARVAGVGEAELDGLLRAVELLRTGGLLHRREAVFVVRDAADALGASGRTGDGAALLTEALIAMERDAVPAVRTPALFALRSARALITDPPGACDDLRAARSLLDEHGADAFREADLENYREASDRLAGECG